MRGSESPVFVKSTGIKLRISDLLIFNDYFRKRISTKIFKILQILCNKVIKYSYVSLETKFSRFLLTKRNRSIFFFTSCLIIKIMVLARCVCVWWKGGGHEFALNGCFTLSQAVVSDSSKFTVDKL